MERNDLRLHDITLTNQERKMELKYFLCGRFALPFSAGENLAFSIVIPEFRLSDI